MPNDALLDSKPLESISRLISVLENAAYLLPIMAKSNHAMFSEQESEPRVFIVLEGCADIWRDIDNCLVETVFAPSIIGLLGAPLRFEGYYIKYSDNCKIKAIPQKLAIDLIEKHNLWRDFLSYLGYLNDHKIHRDMLLINSSSYEIVCMLLNDLMLYSPQERETISIADFILQRSNLSRSGVMRILSDLRFGQYLDIKHGKLVDLLKPLPKNY